MKIHHAVATDVLNIAYAEVGSGGPVAVLLHGFPYDVHAYAEVAPLLAAAGMRVLVPFLRGCGATQFLCADTLRSGEQAALMQDVVDFLDVLGIERAFLAGYDWGGRAACGVAALYPERVQGLLVANGYPIYRAKAALQPQVPEQERRFWYQYYFHGERGRLGLAANRQALCRLLWQEWSPSWQFDDAVFAQTALAFDNPDFVDVVLHSYRHRFGLVAGDGRYAALAEQLEAQPHVAVPTLVLEGLDDGVNPPGMLHGKDAKFTGIFRRQSLAGAGHNLPQEVPQVFARSLLDWMKVCTV